MQAPGLCACLSITVAIAIAYNPWDPYLSPGWPGAEVEFILFYFIFSNNFLPIVMHSPGHAEATATT